MEQIAVIIGNTYIYWSSVIRVLAVAAAVCCFAALYLHHSGRVIAAVIYVPLAIGFSLVLARLARWYFRPDSYETIEAVFRLLQPGGFALMGVFAGCFLAAGLIRLFRLTDNLPELLDCVCIAGSLGIAAGRLALWFNGSDRGMIVDPGRRFPWSSSVVNPVSGAEELRLATFLLQAAVAGLIFLGLLAWYLAGRKHRKDGDAALCFLLFYSATQVLLDSTRYDALHLRSNGFVSVVQVLSACALALVVMLFSARMVRSGGWKKWYLLLWPTQAACFGVAGYMEYYVQRHGSEALFAYSVMGAALLGIVVSALGTWYVAEKEERKHAVWLQQITGVRTEETKQKHDISYR